MDLSEGYAMQLCVCVRVCVCACVCTCECAYMRVCILTLVDDKADRRQEVEDVVDACDIEYQLKQNRGELERS